MLDQSSVHLVIKLIYIVLVPREHMRQGAVPAFLHSSRGESNKQSLMSGS